MESQRPPLINLLEEMEYPACMLVSMLNVAIGDGWRWVAPQRDGAGEGRMEDVSNMCLLKVAAI